MDAALLLSLFILLVSFTYLKNDNKNELSSGSSFNSLQYWSVGRTYPANKIPSNAISDAHNFSANNLNNGLLKTNEPDPWKAIGPDNFGGRTLSIAINPKNPETIYAGSAGGGLWRSYTGGIGSDAWEYIPTGFPVLAVSSIAVDPGDTNRIYIGTGEIYNLDQTGTDRKSVV